MNWPAQMDTDVVVVGGGPAGAAAAITARASGLRVTLVERDLLPRDRPGEAVHPGIEPLLDRLLVLEPVASADFLRHEGQWIAWGGKAQHFVPFGCDKRGPWRGFQLWRPHFDAILLDAAVRAGVKLVRPCRELRPMINGDRIVGVITEHGAWRAPLVIDATGRQRWLARVLRLRCEQLGPRLIAWYGYVQGACPARDAAPAIISDDSGWTWTARVRPTLYQWVRLNADGNAPSRDWLPKEFRHLSRTRSPRGCDVTWSHVRPVAGAGYFLVGDAAFTLDPASSHGMLKALMSGMQAGQIAGDILSGAARSEYAAEVYDAWLAHWFRRDSAELKILYKDLASFAIPPRCGWRRTSRSGARYSRSPSP
jgi:flavin-dependent dehydrogenase